MSPTGAGVAWGRLNLIERWVLNLVSSFYPLSHLMPVLPIRQTTQQTRGDLGSLWGHFFGYKRVGDGKV